MATFNTKVRFNSDCGITVPSTGMELDGRAGRFLCKAEDGYAYVRPAGYTGQVLVPVNSFSVERSGETGTKELNFEKANDLMERAGLKTFDYCVQRHRYFCGECQEEIEIELKCSNNNNHITTKEEGDCDCGCRTIEFRDA